MDAGLLLELCAHLLERHLDLRLRVEKRDTRAVERSIILERIRGRIDGHLLLHLVRIVRIAGKSEPAARQHGGRHRQDQHCQDNFCHDFLSHESYLLF